MDAITAAITAGPEVDRIIHAKTLYLGPDELLVAAKVSMAPGVPLSDISERIDIVEARIREAVPVARVIYLEPAVYQPAVSGADAHP
jgi:divalent metal cation (Fe/Co/Zn/Cd) transporter